MNKLILMSMLLVLLVVIGCTPEQEKLYEEKYREEAKDVIKEAIQEAEEDTYLDLIDKGEIINEAVTGKKANFRIYKVTDDEYTNSEPKTYGDYVVWVSDKNDNMDIFLKNMKTGEVRQITDYEGHECQPFIWDDKIVYARRDKWFKEMGDSVEAGGDVCVNGQIYLYDIAEKTTKKLTLTSRDLNENTLKEGIFDFKNNILYYGIQGDSYLFDVRKNAPVINGKLPKRLMKVCGSKNCYSEHGDVCPYPFTKDPIRACNIPKGVLSGDWSTKIFKIYDHYLYLITEETHTKYVVEGDDAPSWKVGGIDEIWKTPSMVMLYDFNFNEPTDNRDVWSKAVTYLKYPEDRKRINEIRGLTIESNRNCLKEEYLGCRKFEYYYKIFIPSKDEAFVIKGGTYTQSYGQYPKKIKDGDSKILDAFLDGSRENIKISVSQNKVFFVEPTKTCKEYPEGEYCRRGSDIYMMMVE